MSNQKPEAGVFNRQKTPGSIVFGRWLVYHLTMDPMNMTVQELLGDRSRYMVERSFARHCDDPEWVEGLDHLIELIETELNRRVGNPGGRA